MIVDTYDIINSKNSHLALNLLLLPDLKLPLYEKMLMVNHWNLSGKPPMFESRLMEMLGEDAEVCMNPFLIKLYNIQFDKLIADRSNLESLEDKKYKGILEVIFLKKLDLLEEEVSKGGYKATIHEHKHSATKQSLVLNISSRSGKYELFNFSAAYEGYKFLPSIRLLNRPENLNDLLTDQSITNLKGIIYWMTENPNWDRSLLPKSLKFISFKSFILNEMSKAIIKKYYTPDLEQQFEFEDDEDEDV